MPFSQSIGSTAATYSVSRDLFSLEQVRLSLGHYSHSRQTWEVVVFFTTDVSNDVSGLKPVVVAYVEDKSLVDKKMFYGVSDQYEHVRDDRNSGSFATAESKEYSSPWLFHVRVKDLKPCSNVIYEVGLVPDTSARSTTSKKSTKHRKDETEEAEGIIREESFRFELPPSPGSTCVEVGAAKQMETGSDTVLTRVAVVGDIGQTEYSQKTRDAILRVHRTKEEQDAGRGLGFASVVLVGDISYADGDQRRWDSWGRMMEPLTAEIPLMTLPGNHEIELENRTHETFLSYRKRFFMPSVVNSFEETAKASRLSKYHFDTYDVIMHYDYGSSFYSFDIGKIHFVMLNTYDTYSYYSEKENIQALWLERDLKHISRKKTPFVVVCSHAPMYSSSKDHQGEFATLQFKKWVEPLINKYMVNLVLSGHVHAYERMESTPEADVSDSEEQTATKRDVRNAAAATSSYKGPVYITIGDGGNHEKLYDSWVTPRPSNSLFRSGQYYGHGELLVHNDTHMQWIWKPNPSQLTSVETFGDKGGPIDQSNVEDSFSTSNSFDNVWIITNPDAFSTYELLQDVIIFSTTKLVLALFVMVILTVLYKANRGITNIKTSQEEKLMKRNVKMKFEPLRTDEDEFGTFS